MSEKACVICRWMLNVIELPIWVLVALIKVGAFTIQAAVLLVMGLIGLVVLAVAWAVVTVEEWLSSR